jgi:integrase
MLGVDCYQLPPKYVRQPHSAFNPYIFSDDEIVRLLRATDNMTVYRTDSKRMTEVMPIIVRILISTGMRIGEVLALNKTDIDIKTGVIKAVNCKNDVCRYIPMADTLIVSVKAYIETIENNELMFCSPKTGNSYHYNTVRQLFSKLCKTAQIFRTDGTTPNIHSLRHTFCSKSLEQLLASGMDLYTAMPILAAYVGHSHFRDTEFYIHFTETSYNDFINKQKQLRKLIPEVDDE